MSPRKKKYRLEDARRLPPRERSSSTKSRKLRGGCHTFMRAMTTAKTVKYARANAHLASLKGKLNAHSALLLVERPCPANCSISGSGSDGGRSSSSSGVRRRRRRRHMGGEHPKKKKIRGQSTRKASKSAVMKCREMS